MGVLATNKLVCMPSGVVYTLPFLDINQCARPITSCVRRLLASGSLRVVFLTQWLNLRKKNAQSALATHRSGVIDAYVCQVSSGILRKLQDVEYAYIVEKISQGDVLPHLHSNHAIGRDSPVHHRASTRRRQRE